MVAGEEIQAKKKPSKPGFNAFSSKESFHYSPFLNTGSGESSAAGQKISELGGRQAHDQTVQVTSDLDLAT